MTGQDLYSMTPPFLCTTALSEFWDKRADKIVLLGAWCLRYDRREEWQDLNYEILPYPWDDREAMHKAAVYEEEVYEELLGLLSEFLNEVHVEKHNKQYWRIILGPWLLYFIQVLHERYLCLQLAFDRYPGLATIGLAESSFQIPRHCLDHVYGSIDDPYNLQLTTAILQALGWKMPRREFSWSWPSAPKGNVGPFYKRVCKQVWQRVHPLTHSLINWWARRAPILLANMYLPHKQVAQLMVRTGFRARLCLMPESEKWLPTSSPVKLHPLRRNLNDLSLRKNDAFRSFVTKTLQGHLPLIYLEGYRACREWVQQNWNRAKTKAVVTANALTYNESFKFLAAEMKERGAKLIVTQYGGSCGNARYNPFEGYERKAADQFWSWGWGEQADGVKPMPNPKLSFLATRRKSGLQKGEPYIFYVGNSLPRYHFRTWSCPTAHQVLDYLKWLTRFLEAMEVEVRAQLVFRPHPLDWGWSLRRRLREAFPDLRLDSPQSNYHRGLLGASLVIHDANQTTFLESLAANIPTVVFWDPHLWELRADAEPYYRLLHDAGILYCDPMAAAGAVNRIWPEVEKWWQLTKVQQARQTFVQQFALHSSAWLEKWRLGFTKILVEVR